MKNTVDNIQVGKSLYLFNIDRRDKANDKEVFVSKVGKKYFYVSYGCVKLKFDIKTQIHINTPYSPRFKLYKSKEDCEYILETERRRKSIANELYHLLTREEVNRIYDFLILRDERTNK